MGPDLFRLVSVLSVGSSLVGGRGGGGGGGGGGVGRVLFGSLLLRTDQINT